MGFLFLYCGITTKIVVPLIRLIYDSNQFKIGGSHDCNVQL